MWKIPDASRALTADPLIGMSLADSQRFDSPRSLGQRPRCVACQDVIGIYEPLVQLVDGVAWRTSRAAEPTLGAAGGELYHAACYERLDQNRRLAGGSLDP